ncbi:sel1 repeat family protein [Marinobacterium sp. D7]|uniref:tetratricopeptide repeat protein n=1 Tax=Marinobacterium ramblicola TaxID=2849041 RepID=UPI001C2CCEEF|nr:tetratricopeptide repeat protein [Marinobacterium ramblicola]MBV1790083.1 sel1 repeat family protein [Marinobacterium ramblicola]
MRLVMKLLAPLLFWIAYGLFRSRVWRGSRRRHTLAMKLFRLAADNGNRRALSVYGHLLHFRGEGVANRIQGAIYLQRAAEKGDVKALYQMGRIHEQGFEHHFGIEPAQAVQAYRRAAELGHPLAVKRMVELCREGGLGLSPDAEQLTYWQQKQAVFPSNG